MTHAFDYQLAFDRNIGWVTEPEQQVLRSKRVAIAGMGGVGGVHVVTLARLGVQRFNIADFDTFDIANFNRQVGATMSSLGRPKADVLAEMVRDINPEADVRVYPAGIDDGNVADDVPDADALSLGDVLRVSGAGIDRFQGVPMWALAIDDDGDLLLHSRKNPRLDRETLLPPDPPRNLYVLGYDGELARIDALEPDPERTVGLRLGSYRWIPALPM